MKLREKKLVTSRKYGRKQSEGGESIRESVGEQSSQCSYWRQYSSVTSVVGKWSCMLKQQQLNQQTFIYFYVERKRRPITNSP